VSYEQRITEGSLLRPALYNHQNPAPIIKKYLMNVSIISNSIMYLLHRYSFLVWW